MRRGSGSAGLWPLSEVDCGVVDCGKSAVNCLMIGRARGVGIGSGTECAVKIQGAAARPAADTVIARDKMTDHSDLHGAALEIFRQASRKRVDSQVY
jgi:hypothetical protein